MCLDASSSCAADMRDMVIITDSCSEISELSGFNTVLYSYYTIAHQMTAFIKAQVRPWNTEHMQGVRSKQLYSAVFDPREYLLLHTAILDYST